MCLSNRHRNFPRRATQTFVECFDPISSSSSLFEADRCVECFEPTSSVASTGGDADFPLECLDASLSASPSLEAERSGVPFEPTSSFSPTGDADFLVECFDPHINFFVLI